MSEPLRIAIVAEGPTDRIVIEAAIAGILADRPYILRQLQPEESLPFGAVGTGWGGVYRWCRQAVARAGGSLRRDLLFANYDLLVMHLDADVAEKDYASAGIINEINDLPCAVPCPPPHSTTDALRGVLLRWAGEPDLPPKTVLCTPSKSTEAWVLAALYPQDQVVTGGNLECYATPHLRLQAKPMEGRLVAGGKKNRDVYRRKAPEVTENWPRVRTTCTEANRFSVEFGAATPQINNPENN